VREIRGLDRQTAVFGKPVRVRGVVTLAYPGESGTFVLHDGDQGIFVARNTSSPPAAIATLRRGMAIVVEGVTGKGAYAPVLEATRVEVVGEAALPPYELITAAQYMSGRFDCQSVTMRGVVEHVEERSSAERRLVRIASDGVQFLATSANEQGIDADALEDAEVEIRAVAFSFFNDRGELLGGSLKMVGREDITILKPPMGDPFSAPKSSLRTLGGFQMEQAWPHRRRFAGVVTLHRPGEFFYMEDEGRAVRVWTRQAGVLPVGARVEAAGFMGMGPHWAEVREAVFRVLEQGAEPKATPLTWATKEASRPVSDGRLVFVSANHPIKLEESQPDLDGKLVRMTGRLERVDAEGSGGLRLRLDHEGHPLSVEFSGVPRSEVPVSWTPGALVSVTGICVVELSARWPAVDSPLPQGLHLLARSRKDVVVLEAAPWWTPARFWMALSAMAALIGAGLMWLWLLRRTVRRQTARLEVEIRERHHTQREFEATLRERHRLAAELHDTLEQGLTAVALEMEAARALASRPEAAGQHSGAARDLLDRYRDDLRRAIWSLRAGALDGATLQEALVKMAAEMEAQHGIACEVSVKGDVGTLPDLAASNLYHLAHEAAVNAVKHGGARHLVISLEESVKAVCLTVQDDGCGFDPLSVPGPQQGHFGLLGMRERMQVLGGELRVESRLGEGTVIRASIPGR